MYIKKRIVKNYPLFLHYLYLIKQVFMRVCEKGIRTTCFIYYHLLNVATLVMVRIVANAAMVKSISILTVKREATERRFVFCKKADANGIFRRSSVALTDFSPYRQKKCRSKIAVQLVLKVGDT